MTGAPDSLLTGPGGCRALPTPSSILGPSSAARVSSALAIQHRSPAAHCHSATLLSLHRVSRAPLTVGGLLALCCICGLVGGGIFLIMKKKKEGGAAGGGQAQGGVALSAPVAAAVDTKI